MIAALRRSWWLVLLGVVVGGAAGVAVSVLATPLYTCKTQLFVSTTDSTSTTAALQGSQFSAQRVTSYAQLLTGEDMAGRVVQRLNLNMTPSALSRELTATPVTDTVLIDVTVTDSSAVRAQQIATAIGPEFANFVRQLETPDGGGSPPVKVTVTQAADLPEAPSSPQTTKNVALGVLGGLLVGVLLAVGRARLDRSIRDPEDASGIAKAPVIGTVVRDEALADGHVMSRGSGARVAEDFRQLRASLQFLDVDNPPKVIMISSPMPAEGKTTVVINLALALAEVGQRVAVIEADLRRSRLTRYLGLVAGAGLTNVLAGTADVADVAQPYGEGQISLIGAGPTPPNPSQLLSSGHMATLIEELRGKNDYVLVDAPPLLPVADSIGLAPLVDGVVLSVRYGKTRKDQLQQGVAKLDRVGGKVLGVILNIVPPKSEVAGAYGYGYSYSEDEPRRGRQQQRGRRRAGRGAGTPVSDITS